MDAGSAAALDGLGSKVEAFNEAEDAVTAVMPSAMAPTGRELKLLKVVLKQQIPDADLALENWRVAASASTGVLAAVQKYGFTAAIQTRPGLQIVGEQDPSLG